MYDVAVIGCGIIGANVANLLSRYDLSLAVLEKENDVSMGTTRANSAIIHAGYDPEPGTEMARLNVRGNELTRQQCEAYQVSYKQIGSLVCAFDEADEKTVEKLYRNGVENGVPGVKILSAEEVREMEPNLSQEVRCALWAPSAGIVAPWELCFALAEAAVKNGAEIHLNTAVTGIEKNEDSYTLHTNQGDFQAKVVINAAGVEADTVTGLIAAPGFETAPNKGEYYLMDKSQGTLVNHVIFQCPNKDGKGVLVSPTVHGNLIVGPNAAACERGDVATSAEGLAFVRNAAVKSVPTLAFRDNIRNFAGVRANSNRSDFVIEETLPGLITLGAIKSPGLSSAPAIAEDAVKLVENTLTLTEKESYVNRREVTIFRKLSPEGKAEAVKNNPLYGRIICRCETITEGEIVDALHGVLPPHTIDGVKRRCNAGMGRCQGGFCGPRVHEIIARELGMDPKDVLKDKEGSVIIIGETKGGAL
ncbi:MAG: NAD(P)/FAD-dependent oxidoreductase [Ruminococcaceae bacterium]|nr:NAD(P)/FAD-dependent oxidoreductase [Oscillospiraceae bacterium]